VFDLHECSVKVQERKSVCLNVDRARLNSVISNLLQVLQYIHKN